MKLAAISILSLLVWSSCKFDNKSNTVLPIYGNREPVTKTVNGKTVTDTVYQTIPDFNFVNQYGKQINRKSLDGSIYVADFFFTSCPSICPVMHRNMLKVYEAFKNNGNIKILSHSIDPKHDSVPVLKKYAENLGVSGNNWWFLQGNKEATYKLAQSYMVAAQEDKDAPGGIVHSGFFILVDKQKRIRGTYNGTEPAEVDKLIADIKILQNDPSNMIAQ